MTCSYTILTVKRATQQSPLGGFVEGQDVWFETPGSPAQKVFVSDAQFTKENVDAEIQKRCAVIASLINPNG